MSDNMGKAIRNLLPKIQDNNCDTTDYENYALLIWTWLNNGQQEVLKQLLFQGPVYDGNVISKSYRDDLIDYDLAVRCCFLGEQGYTAATYLAYTVWKCGKGEAMEPRLGSSDFIPKLARDRIVRELTKIVNSGRPI